MRENRKKCDMQIFSLFLSRNEMAFLRPENAKIRASRSLLAAFVCPFRAIWAEMRVKCGFPATFEAPNEAPSDCVTINEICRNCRKYMRRKEKARIGAPRR